MYRHAPKIGNALTKAARSTKSRGARKRESLLVSSLAPLDALSRLCVGKISFVSGINGYFGGYIGKRQKIGQLETKKCIDKMVSLRERDKNKTIKQQKRAVNGRMITDVEMNGTARGASKRLISASI